MFTSVSVLVVLLAYPALPLIVMRPPSNSRLNFASIPIPTDLLFTVLSAVNSVLTSYLLYS